MRTIANKEKCFRIIFYIIIVLISCKPSSSFACDLNWNSWEGICWKTFGSELRMKGNSVYDPFYGPIWFHYNLDHTTGTDKTYPWHEYKHQIMYIKIEGGISYIGDSYFSEFYNLINIEIPYTVTTIGARAFYACLSLKSITIPHSISYIGVDAFYMCTNLESVELSERLKSIEPGTFLECKKLKKIELPESLILIGNQAFHNCNSISSIEIPNSVQWIGDDAFDNYVTIFTTHNSIAEQWAAINNRRVVLVKEKIDSETYEMIVNVHNLNWDGSKGVPFDLENSGITFSIILTSNVGHHYESYPTHLKIQNLKKTITKTFIATFQEELPLSGRNNLSVSLDGLPDYVFGNSPYEHKYFLDYRAWINKKGDIEIYFIWKDDIYTPELTNGFNRSVSLPEDEIGAYSIKPDGSKEYLLFQTYDICMQYLGDNELCSGNERCFHK